MTGCPVLLAFMLVCTAPAPAQEPAGHQTRIQIEQHPALEATLEITVQDETRARIPGAYIRLRSGRSNSPFDVRGDQIGIATTPLEPAVYEMSVFAPGFKKWDGEVTVKDKLLAAVQLTLVALYEGYLGPVVAQESVDLERFNPDTTIPLVPLLKLDLTPHKQRRGHVIAR